MGKTPKYKASDKAISPRRQRTLFFVLKLLVFSFLVNLAMPHRAEAGGYVFAVKGAQVLINQKPFKVIGLRVSNALISDDTANQLIQNLERLQKLRRQHGQRFRHGLALRQCQRV